MQKSVFSLYINKSDATFRKDGVTFIERWVNGKREEDTKNKDKDAKNKDKDAEGSQEDNVEDGNVGSSFPLLILI